MYAVAPSMLLELDATTPPSASPSAFAAKKTLGACGPSNRRAPNAMSTASGADSVAAAEDPASVLTRAVHAVFSRWFALRIATEQAGREGAAVADALLQDALLLAHSSLVPTVDDYLELMDDAFEQLHTNVEDGSMEEVANLLLRMRNAAAAGDLGIARRQIEKQQNSEAPLPWNVTALSMAVSNARR
jgi:hypothetical protein